MGAVRDDAAPTGAQLDVDLFAAAPDGIVVIDRAGVMLAVNEQLGQMFGYDSDELIGEQIEVLIPDRFRDGHVTRRKAYVDAPTRRPMGAGLTLFGRRRSGEEFPVDISLNYERRANGSVRAVAFV